MCLGPGTKSPEERTMDYLEEVAIQAARFIHFMLIMQSMVLHLAF